MTTKSYLTYGFTPVSGHALPAWHETINLPDPLPTWAELQELSGWFTAAVEAWDMFSLEMSPRFLCSDCAHKERRLAHAHA